MLREWITKKEAARELACSTRQIERLAEDGQLRKQLDGRTPLFRAGDVERVRADRAAPQPPLHFGEPLEVTGPPQITRALTRSPRDAAALAALFQQLPPAPAEEPKPLYCGLREASAITGLPMRLIRERYAELGLRWHAVGGRTLVNRKDLELI